jgi:hypothetical protein
MKTQTKSERPAARVTGPAMPKRGEGRATGSEMPRRKNLRLHQSKIDRARKILGTETETETIEQALDMIVLRNNLVRGVRAMRDASLSSPFVD